MMRCRPAPVPAPAPAATAFGLAALVLLPVAFGPSASLNSHWPGRESAEATAVFAGGCFWGVESVFKHLRGVRSATSGFAGGVVVHPSYEEVSSGQTGHVETVRVVYDPSQITYRQLLEVFFTVAHDPTQRDRQGPDVGPQYRAVVFFEDVVQREIAEAYVTELENAKVFRKPIVTEINPLEIFYPAEAYHQDYAAHHPTDPYIVFNDLPKLRHLRDAYPNLYKTSGDM